MYTDSDGVMILLITSQRSDGRLHHWVPLQFLLHNYLQLSTSNYVHQLMIVSQKHVLFPFSYSDSLTHCYPLLSAGY